MKFPAHLAVATAAELLRRRGLRLNFTRLPLRGAGEKRRLQLDVKPLPEKKP